MQHLRSKLIAIMILTALVGASSAQWRSPSGDPLSPPLPAPRISVKIADGGSFIHIALDGVSGNIQANQSSLTSNYIGSLSSPMTDNNPAAIVFLTHNLSPSTAFQTAPYGAYYAAGKSWVFNQNALLPFSPGAAFNVQVQGKSDSIFVHTASAGSIGDPLTQLTFIDHPLTNGDDSASLILSVTPNWTGTYNDRQVGVYYDSTAHKWSIFNEDVSPMPVGAAFNVQVMQPSTVAFSHVATAGNIVSTSKTEIDNAILNGNSGAQFIVTQNYSAGLGVYNDNPIGVQYDGAAQKWRIVNVNGAVMPVGAGFNIHITNSGDVFGDGVLNNGSFEAPGATSKNLAIRWNSTAAGAGSKRVCNKYFPKSPATKIVANSGECSFLLVGAAGQTRKLTQTATFPAIGRGMDLLVWLNGKNLIGFSVKAKIKTDIGGTFSLHLVPAEINGTYDWKNALAGIDLPEGQLPVKYALTFTVTGGGKVYIDDVSAANYIVLR